MLFPETEEKLRNARSALDRATTEDIVRLCQQYLTLLAQYRSQLYKLPDMPGINLRPEGSPSLEEIASTRKAVRGAIEHTTREREKAEALLRSFISVSGYETAETFNRRKYKGYDNWEVRAGGVARFSGGAALDRMPIHEAVDLASLFRREDYIAQSATLIQESQTALRTIPPNSELLKAPLGSAR